MLKQRLVIICGLLFSLMSGNYLHADNKPYSIVNGKVDGKTFQGWQTFKSTCGLCHGDSGQGNPAPALNERLRVLSKEQFVNIVTNGKGLMPPWKTNSEVMDNLDNIYGYLKARADKALGAGQPEKQ